MSLPRPDKGKQALRATPFSVTASGRQWFFLDPRPGDVHFPDIAEALGRVPRYAAATEGAPYSVAQHCVLGLEYCTPEARPYFLLHDAHEAYLGDWITPLQWALEDAAVNVADGAGLDVPDQAARLMVRLALMNLKEQADIAIHAAAGLAWPRPASIEQEVKSIDRHMLGREVKWLIPDGPARRVWFDNDPALARTPKGKAITPWHWASAVEMYTQEMDVLLPSRQPPSAPTIIDPVNPAKGAARAVVMPMRIGACP